MSKKNFTGGLGSLLGEKSEKPKRGVTRKDKKPVIEETRATFILESTLLEKMKAIAYWERLLIKEVVQEALQKTIAAYEKKNGKIRPIPKRGS